MVRSKIWPYFPQQQAEGKLLKLYLERNKRGRIFFHKTKELRSSIAAEAGRDDRPLTLNLPEKQRNCSAVLRFTLFVKPPAYRSFC